MPRLRRAAPEARRTEHPARYLRGFARNYNLRDQIITTRLREGVSGVFFEDGTMPNPPQRAAEADPGRELYDLDIDAGGPWTSRPLRRTAEAENGAADAREEAAGAAR